MKIDDLKDNQAKPIIDSHWSKEDWQIIKTPR
jgi:hypothetical protein